MPQPFDFENWNRREHFEFFARYELPYWGVTCEVDCTEAYRRAGEEKYPFFLGYHYASIRAVNEVEALRMRIESDRAILFDRVHVSTTIARPDGTFGFSFMPYEDDFQRFLEQSVREIRRIRAETGLKIPYFGQDIVYYTVLRGLRMTSMDHARRTTPGAAVPLMAFGEAYEKEGRRLLPHSIHVHHALVDGPHVAAYFERFQHYLDQG